MIKTIAIVSLSRGTIGEASVRHEISLGIERLASYGITVRFMPHALKGIQYVKEHPEDRAADLLQAFEDPEIDMILCAIGGDDTYRLLPYLFDHDELFRAVSDKVFLGFSDSTLNHLMLHKVGLRTFYGQSFLSDVCELEREMLPYTRHYFEELLRTGTISEIVPSEQWYDSRKTFGRDLNCCRGGHLFPERYWAAVSIPCMICSMETVMRICLFSAASTVFSRPPMNGKEKSCFWNPARKKCPRKSTERLWVI